MWVERVLGLDMTLGLDSLSATSGLFSKMSIDLHQGQLAGLARVSRLSTPPAGFGAGYRYRQAECPEFRDKVSRSRIRTELSNNTRTAGAKSRSTPRAPRGLSTDNGVRNENFDAGETISRAITHRKSLTKLILSSLRTPSSKPREFSTRAAQSPFPTHFRTCGTCSRARQLAHTMPRNN